MNGPGGSLPNPTRRKDTRLLAALVIPALLVVLTMMLGRSSILNSSAKTSVYKLKNDLWSKTDSLPGEAIDIQVSPSGVVWVSTSFRAGLTRTTDGHWTSYSGSDFGTTTNYAWGGFALSGEEVWGATQEGVIHYDGKTWRLHKDALATDKPASLIAYGNHVWVIDDDGNFSVFDGSRWTIRSLRQEMPSVSWSGDMSLRRPALSLDLDGTVWLSWKGLWRLRGGKWDEVRPNGVSGKNTDFAGATSDGIWIMDGTELIAMDASGQVVAHVRKSDIGLGPSGTTYRVASSGGSLWVATSEGLFKRESGSWQKMQSPAASANNIERVAFAPDSSVWVIGVLPVSASRFGPLFGMIALSMASLILMTRALAKRAQGRLDRGASVRETVQQAAGTLPESGEPILTREELEKKTSPERLSVAFLAIVLVPAAIAVAALFLLRRYWPDAPQWILPVGFTVTGLIIGLVVTYRRTVKSGKSKPVSRRVVTALLTFASFYLLEFVMRQAPKWVPGKFSWWWGIVGIIVLGLIAAFFLPVVGDILPIMWVNRALRRADYREALRRVEMFLRLRPKSAGLLYTRGTVLWLAGEQREAEESLRQAVTAGQMHADALQALHLENLAFVLMEQGRYEEAIRSLEGSIRIDPDRGGTYLPLAETYLRQQTEPAKALAMADRAIELKEKSPMQKRANRQAYADAWALRAWALSVLGRRVEADESIRKALSESDHNDKPNFAGTLYHLGQALVSQGNRSAAVARFDEARKVDPGGNYGSLAARALREHSIWGDRR